jgi:hypothetical protein
MNMLKIIPGAILVLLLSACSKDFQSSNWGDSMEEVKNSEKVSQWYQSESPDGSQSAIYYEGQVDSLPAIIFYAFSYNELIWGKHVFAEEHALHEQYHSDYLIVNSALKDRFGFEAVDYMFSTDKYKNSPDQWGEAIYQGDLLIQTKWANKSSEVLHAIFAKDREITHSVEYQSVQAHK